MSLHPDLKRIDELVAVFNGPLWQEGIYFKYLFLVCAVGGIGRYAPMYSARRGQKMVLDPLELELQGVVLPGMDPGN